MKIHKGTHDSNALYVLDAEKDVIQCINVLTFLSFHEQGCVLLILKS